MNPDMTTSYSDGAPSLCSDIKGRTRPSPTHRACAGSALRVSKIHALLPRSRRFVGLRPDRLGRTYGDAVAKSTGTRGRGCRRRLGLGRVRDLQVSSAIHVDVLSTAAMARLRARDVGPLPAGGAGAQ